MTKPRTTAQPARVWSTDAARYLADSEYRARCDALARAHIVGADGSDLQVHQYPDGRYLQGRTCLTSAGDFQRDTRGRTVFQLVTVHIDSEVPLP